MKKGLIGLLVILGLVSSSVVMAAQGIDSSTVIQTSTNTNSNAIATGKDSKANVGTMNVTGGIKGSTVIQTSTNTNSNAIATGKGSEANVGTMNVK